MIFITAKFRVRPEHADAWPEITRQFTAATRSEPGCLWFDWSRSLDDPNEYVLVEAFRDGDAGAAHVQSDHFGRLGSTCRRTWSRRLASSARWSSRTTGPSSASSASTDRHGTHRQRLDGRTDGELSAPGDEWTSALAGAALGPCSGARAGLYDALGARLVEQAGFDAVYMTGFGTAASLLGRPDVGLLALAEMVDNARRIAQAVEVPVIADADTGYGNAINVIRTVREYERAGVAAIHLEDQVSPKSCGHMDGKQVVPDRRDGRQDPRRGRPRGARRTSSSSPAPTRARSRGSTPRSSGRARYRDAARTCCSSRRRSRGGDRADRARSSPDVPLLFN